MSTHLEGSAKCLAAALSLPIERQPAIFRVDRIAIKKHRAILINRWQAGGSSSVDSTVE